MISRIPLDSVCDKKIETLSSSYNGIIEYIDISSIDNSGKSILSTQIIDSKEAPSRAKQLVKKGDILVSTVRPNLNAVAVIEQESNHVLVASTGYCVLRCNSEVNNRYVFYFCQSPYFIEDMVRQATGASYPAVSNSIVKSCLIPLHNLEKQVHVATALDKISNFISLRKQQLAKLDELVKSRFVEMFETGKHPRCPVEDLCAQIVDCPHTTPKYKGVLLSPAIRTSEIKKGYIVWDTMKYVSDDEYDERIARLKPEAGDIVYGREGTFGNAAIFPAGYKFCLGQRVMLLRPDYAKCTSEYLLHAILSDDVYRQALGKNNASTVAHVNVSDVKKFIIPLPPINLQSQFAAFVEHTDKSKLTIRQGLDKLETLKKALMQSYFG